MKRYTVVVSQDGYFDGVAAVAREFPVQFMQHPRDSAPLDNPQFIARHYKYAYSHRGEHLCLWLASP